MTSDEIKKNAGCYAVNFIKQGMAIGIGSGTTVYWFIQELGKRVGEGMLVKAVPTSIKTRALAHEAGIVTVDLNEVQSLAVTIDGADEIDPVGQLIKGGGGALLQEKIVASASDDLVIIADSSKLVKQLGKFPLPVEVIPYGHRQVERTILSSGLCNRISLRTVNGEIFVTDHQHYILDCEFEKISDASELNTALHLIPGVVETGLFINMANKAVIGYEDGKIDVIKFK